MTTDDFAEIEAKLDRIIELLEGRKAHKCGVCEQRKRGNDALTEQWRDECLERHGLAGEIESVTKNDRN